MPDETVIKILLQDEAETDTGSKPSSDRPTANPSLPDFTPERLPEPQIQRLQEVKQDLPDPIVQESESETSVLPESVQPAPIVSSISDFEPLPTPVTDSNRFSDSIAEFSTDDIPELSVSPSFQKSVEEISGIEDAALTDKSELFVEKTASGEPQVEVFSEDDTEANVYLDSIATTVSQIEEHAGGILDTLTSGSGDSGPGPPGSPQSTFVKAVKPGEKEEIPEGLAARAKAKVSEVAKQGLAKFGLQTGASAFVGAKVATRTATVGAAGTAASTATGAAGASIAAKTGLAGLATLISGPFAIFTGLAVATFAVTKSFQALSRKAKVFTSGLAESVKDLSSEVATEIAQAEIRDQLVRLERAGSLGKELAEFTRLQSQMSATIEEIKTDVGGPIITILNSLTKDVQNGLTVINYLTEAVNSLNSSGSTQFAGFMKDISFPQLVLLRRIAILLEDKIDDDPSLSPTLLNTGFFSALKLGGPTEPFAPVAPANHRPHMRGP